jgi:uncharacterized peroxidase-related enzyme
MTTDYTLTLPAISLETAAPQAKAVLEKAKAQVGFIPNMYGGMANSPALLDTYLDGYERFRKASGFTPAEQEIVFLTISRNNECSYCMAAHSMLADKMSNVPVPVTDALRAALPIPDAKLSALSTFTDVMVSTRGLPQRGDVETFLSAGYQEQHILDIILAIAVKTLSNYSNHLFQPPVDAMFAGRVWKPAS